MSFEMLSCSEEEAEWIEEQAARVFDTIAPPEEGAEEEEFVYKVTDEEGKLLRGCILAVDERKTASIFNLWVEEAYRSRGIASALIRVLHAFGLWGSQSDHTLQEGSAELICYRRSAERDLYGKLYSQSKIL